MKMYGEFFLGAKFSVVLDSMKQIEMCMTTFCNSKFTLIKIIFNSMVGLKGLGTLMCT